MQSLSHYLVFVTNRVEGVRYPKQNVTSILIREIGSHFLLLSRSVLNTRIRSLYSLIFGYPCTYIMLRNTIVLLRIELECCNIERVDLQNWIWYWIYPARHVAAQEKRSIVGKRANAARIQIKLFNKIERSCSSSYACELRQCIGLLKNTK